VLSINGLPAAPLHPFSSFNPEGLLPRRNPLATLLTYLVSEIDKAYDAVDPMMEPDKRSAL